MTIELTPELLRDYFTAHLDEPVGAIGCCPLQMVLIANGIPHAQIGYDTWFLTHLAGSPQAPLPDWAQRFVRGVDSQEQPPRTSIYVLGDKWRVTTGAIALDILERALEATA